MYNVEKYVTNISDLVISAMTIGDTIRRKAESGDPEACFQMGMIHLLGMSDDLRLENLSSDIERLRAIYYNETNNSYTLFTPFNF